MAASPQKPLAPPMRMTFFDILRLPHRCRIATPYCDIYKPGILLLLWQHAANKWIQCRASQQSPSFPCGTQQNSHDAEDEVSRSTAAGPPGGEKPQDAQRALRCDRHLPR